MKEGQAGKNDDTCQIFPFFADSLGHISPSSRKVNLPAVLQAVDASRSIPLLLSSHTARRSRRCGPLSWNFSSIHASCGLSEA